MFTPSGARMSMSKEASVASAHRAWIAVRMARGYSSTGARSASPQALPDEDQATTLAVWQRLRYQLAQARILYIFSRVFLLATDA